jgi:CRP/FNR family transcriptional regulator
MEPMLESPQPSVGLAAAKQAPRAQVACAVCAFNPMCHSRSASPGELSPVETRRRLTAGEALFNAGSPSGSIFAVRSGFMKARVTHPGGGTHIACFLLPGDVAGLDGFATGVHRSDAVALGDCEVCEIPSYRVEILSDSSPRVSGHFRRLLAEELAGSQQHAAALACLSVERRIAHFLLDLGRRWFERGYSASAFQLPMSRRDIGEHLGLTAETLSRELSAFQARGWVAMQRRAVEIRNAHALRALLAARA